MTTDGMTTNGQTEQNGKISLEMLAKMTGFPVEMIKEEIFKSQNGSEDISLEDLRTAMLSYIDSTMFMGEEK